MTDEGGRLRVGTLTRFAALHDSVLELGEGGDPTERVLLGGHVREVEEGPIVESKRGVSHTAGIRRRQLLEGGLDQPLVLIGLVGGGCVADDDGARGRAFRLGVSILEQIGRDCAVDAHRHGNRPNGLFRMGRTLPTVNREACRVVESGGRSGEQWLGNVVVTE